MVRFEPYHSPANREREEYEAEASSFVVLKPLETYAAPDEIARVLSVPTSATQRLELEYEIMLRHRDELAEMAERISRKLTECGEEYTDLW